MEKLKGQIISWAIRFAGIVVAITIIGFWFGSGIATIVSIFFFIYLLYKGLSWMEISLKSVEGKKQKALEREEKRRKMLEQEEDRLWIAEERKKIKSRLDKSRRDKGEAL